MENLPGPRPTDMTTFKKCDQNFTIFSTETNTTIPLNCVDQFMSYTPTYKSAWLEFRVHLQIHYIALAVLAQFITISSAFSKSGLPRFGDLILGKENRLIWVCLHVAMCETIFLILFDTSNLAMPFFNIDWRIFYTEVSPILFRIVAIIFYFFFYSGIFVATAHSTVFNLVIGSGWLGYHIALLCLDLHLLIPWFGIDLKIPEIIFAMRGPTIIAYILILGYYLKELHLRFVLSRYQTGEDTGTSFFYKIFCDTGRQEISEQLFSISPNSNYSEELKTFSFYQEVDALLNPSRNITNYSNSFYWQFLSKLGYKPKHGYRYPIKVLCGVACTLVLIWDVLHNFFWVYLPLAGLIIEGSNELVEKAQEVHDMVRTYDAILFNGTLLGNNSTVTAERISIYIIDTANIFYITFLIAMGIALLNCLVGILNHLLQFRYHNRRIRRGYRQDIPTDKLNAFTCISSGMKYGAYICAYPIWGLVLQLFIWFLVLFIAAEVVILPIKIDGKNAWIFDFLRVSWTGWLYTIGIVVIQALLSRFVFSIDRNATKIGGKGKYDRSDGQGHIYIKNRYLYDMLSVFFWFNYMFIGFFSLLLRIIMTMGMALIFIGRLDQPAIQRNYETLDAGYATYLGYQGFEEANTHPVVLVSLQFFLSGPAGLRYRTRIARQKCGSQKLAIESKNSNSNTESSSADIDMNLHTKLMKSSKYRAKWRWQFAYMMVKNPSLIAIRENSMNRKIEKGRVKEI